MPSVLRNSRLPYELIFIDIGSLDGTSEYLAGVAAASNIRIEIARTATDLGIGDAVSQGLKLARGKYLVLLNNDVIVTDAWLEQLISLAGTSQTLGMVGPMTNYAVPGQLVESVPYRIGPKKTSSNKNGTLPEDFLVDVREVYRFAQNYREENRGHWIEMESFGGFCVLIKRAVLNKIESITSLRFSSCCYLSRFEVSEFNGNANSEQIQSVSVLQFTTGTWRNLGRGSNRQFL